MRALNNAECQAVAGGIELPFEAVLGSSVAAGAFAIGTIVSLSVGLGQLDQAALTASIGLGTLTAAAGVTSGVLADLYYAQQGYVYYPTTYAYVLV